MKKLTARLVLLALMCALMIPGVLKTDAAAAELSGETVYSTTDVNVRTGPGTKHGIIGVLHRGNSVVRTESGSNGWSKVIFDGSEGYVRSRYLSAARNGAAHREDEHQGPSFDEAEVAFEPVSQTVYALTDVNVRTGPGTQYESLGSCAFGEALNRTGIGANGWSRVIYKGETAYIHGKYLADSRAEVQDSGEVGQAYGQLTIPAVGIDVKLYYCASDADQIQIRAQRIVDADNSAAYLDQASVEGVIIADHKHQGFDAIRSCVAHKTRAYIDFGTYTQEYICTAVGTGTNTGKDLLDWNKNSLNYGSIPGGLAMYTCNETWNDITITYWKKV